LPSGLKIGLLLLLLLLSGCGGFRALASSEFFAFSSSRFLLRVFLFAFSFFAFEPASPCCGNDTFVDQCVLALDYAFGATRGPLCAAAPETPSRFCLIFQVVAPRSSETSTRLSLL
jgi:hypothetical protein